MLEVKFQKLICSSFKAEYVASPADFKVGIALNTKSNLRPIHGLRHSIQGDTTGWYIWAGEELSADPNFFVPLCVKHLQEWCPDVIKYLGLAPGWRFLIDDEGYQDVWYDASLLDI